MDIERILSELNEEYQRLDEAIAALERLAGTRPAKTQTAASELLRVADVGSSDTD